jgi:hypothetical protein
MVPSNFLDNKQHHDDHLQRRHGTLSPLILTTVGTSTTDPTFTTILAAHVELNANIASILSARGDGIHGLVGICRHY